MSRPSLFGVFGALVALALCLGACSNMNGSQAQQVREWASGASYTSDNAQIVADFASLQAGVRTNNLRSLRTECAGFGVDAETLAGELPTPDTDITNELDSALSSFYNAALECFKASSFTDAAFHTYQRDLASGKTVYARATKRLREDGVR